jgi:histone H3/H4
MQRGAELIIPPLRMTKVIREIMQVTPNVSRIQASAVEALCEASEAHLLTLFESK